MYSVVIVVLCIVLYYYLLLLLLLLFIVICILKIRFEAPCTSFALFMTFLLAYLYYYRVLLSAYKFTVDSR